MAKMNEQIYLDELKKAMNAMASKCPCE